MISPDLFLITPPFTQLNTPYPATPYLKGFLNTKNINAYQIDLGIEVILRLFSRNGLQKMFDFAEQQFSAEAPALNRVFALREDYIHTIDGVIAFLQGRNELLARQICSGNLLPQAGRFEQIDDLEWAFGSMGMQDKAKHLATLYLEDLSDFIVACIDENFGFSRYAERLGRSANDFEELHDHLQKENTFIDNITLEILDDYLKDQQPGLICFSVPFPGNLYSAFRCAQFIKHHYPKVKTAMGGGFPNTELRSVSDVRVFDYFDYITLDDGELPMELLVERLNNADSDPPVFKRTFHKEKEIVSFVNNSEKEDYKQKDCGTPDYSDLPLDRYISVIEIANPMHSLWSDGRWIKLTMAHGCYWGKCTFCDISLNYIKAYEPVAAGLLVDRMQQLMEQTGETGFHFVDEAAPPALMRALALEIIRRKLVVTWWTNIRFEKNFTKDLCQLLSASGCIAVSGGLEVASDRLLKLIQKGVSVEQVAKVTANFTDAGIMVHAYLMYGFPTQTIQETIDSLEMVRQMFEFGIIQSGFWHRFALTAHSPIGLKPSEFGITPDLQTITFANNDILFEDQTGIDHSQFSYGLRKSLYNYMHSIGFDIPLQEWFDTDIPDTNIQSDYIENCLALDSDFQIRPEAKIIWLGRQPSMTLYTKTRKGLTVSLARLTFHQKANSIEISMEEQHAYWMAGILNKASVYNDIKMTLGEMKADFELHFEDFELFWYSKPMEALKANGLLTL